MGSVGKALAVTDGFTFNKRDYALEVRNFETEVLIETFLEDRALQAIRRHAYGMSPGEYAELLRIWDQDCAAGVYSFRGTAYWRVMMTAAGLKHRTYLDLFQANGKKVTEELVERIYKDRTPYPTGAKDKAGKPMTESKWDELVRRLDEINDPNPAAPETGQETEEEAAVPDAPPPPAPETPPEMPPGLAG